VNASRNHCERKVALYPTPYYLRVTELIGGNYVKAPTVTSSKTANPEIVYFK
jgi:hypothetical protein